MEIRQISVNDIKVYEKNAKKHTGNQIEAIANSIKKFGFRQPLVLDGNNEIIIGHGRYEAAKLLGYAEIPCVMADDLTPEQVKALRIADNKLNESEWDFDLLSEELGELGDLDMTDFGFNEAEILELTIDDSPEEIPAAPIQPTYNTGDEYPVFNSTEAPGAASYSPESASNAISKEEIDQYAQNAEKTLTRRVIIVYSSAEEEEFLKALLEQDKERPLGVVIDVRNIINGKQGNEQEAAD